MPNSATLIAYAILLVVVADISWRAYLRAHRSGVERPMSRAVARPMPLVRSRVPATPGLPFRQRFPGARRASAGIAAIVAVAVLAVLASATGAPTQSRLPQIVANSEAMVPGTILTISGWGFPASQEGEIVIDGATGVVGTYRARSDGTFSVTVVVPELVPGDHTISATAPNVVAATLFTVVPGEVAAATSSAEASVDQPTSLASPTPDESLDLPTATPAPTAPAPTPIPTTVATSGDHVFLIVMENHASDQVWGSASAPYITSLGNAGALASNYFAITHPSLPNYLDLFGGSSYTITDDCSPSASCNVDAPNLGDSLDAAGRTWKGYFESMPSTCGTANSGPYAVRHNPFVYFDDIRLDAARCAAHSVPYSQLASDLASNATTPNFVWITPNVCSDMHDCGVATGNGWLGSNIPSILTSQACVVDRCLVILTWDEDDGSQSNQVLTIFAGSAAQAGAVSTIRHDHFDLLRTIEDFFGLPTLTANDAAAVPMSELLR